LLMPSRMLVLKGQRPCERMSSCQPVGDPSIGFKPVEGPPSSRAATNPGFLQSTAADLFSDDFGALHRRAYRRGSEMTEARRGIKRAFSRRASEAAHALPLRLGDRLLTGISRMIRFKTALNDLTGALLQTDTGRRECGARSSLRSVKYQIWRPLLAPSGGHFGLRNGMIVLTARAAGGGTGRPGNPAVWRAPA
jgi:hypothetical protein